MRASIVTEAGDDTEQRYTRRQSQAPPILNKIRAWCEEKLGDLLPKSPTTGAINYVLKNWSAPSP